MGKRMGFSEKETGRMTLRKFSLLYEIYKKTFDLEMTMQTKGIRYEELFKEATISDVIPF